MLQNSISEILAKKEISYGIKVYERIMEEVENLLPLNENCVFIELFDNFYHLTKERIPFRDINKKMTLFEKFEELRQRRNSGEKLTFDDIVNEISQIDNESEGVLSTKILHTLYPEYPIMDSVLGPRFEIVYRNNNLYKTIPEKIRFFSSAYEEYKKKFGSYVRSFEGRRLEKLFERAYPRSNINDVKIIDFILSNDK